MFCTIPNLYTCLQEKQYKPHPMFLLCYYKLIHKQTFSLWLLIDTWFRFMSKFFYWSWYELKLEIIEMRIRLFHRTPFRSDQIILNKTIDYWCNLVEWLTSEVAKIDSKQYIEVFTSHRSLELPWTCTRCCHQVSWKILFFVETDFLS